MDAKEHKRIREALGLSQWELAGIMGCGQSAIAGREIEGQTARPVPDVAALLMRYMEKFGTPDNALKDIEGCA